MQIKLRYVHKDTSRHGQVRYYFRARVGAPKIRLPARPGDADFHAKYHELLSGVASTASAAGGDRLGRACIPAGSFRWLAVQYFKSPAFKHMGASTQAARRRVIEHMLLEETKPGAKLLYADVRLRDLTLQGLRILRDRKAGLPGAASDRVKALRALFSWAVAEQHIAANPARDLTKLRLPGSGFHSWTVEEVGAYEKRHPVGTKARLALALLLWTGVRRSDVVLLGRQHVHGGWLRFVQFKNRDRRPVRTEIPILPELQRVIDASPCGDLTFLVNDYGRPFTVNGFGNKMRAWCIEAGVPGSAHGLRKAGAVTAAENGATAHQLMSIFGWLSLSEAERYTRAAARKKMAGEAMGLLVRKD